MRKTKIVCTIGPASGTEAGIEALIMNGMNVARLNFSHGTFGDHLRKIRMIRRLSAKLKRPVAILQDLPGPKIRVGTAPEGGLQLEVGAEFSLTTRKIKGRPGIISVSYPDLPREVKIGDRILLADGLMELSVINKSDTDITGRIVVGGVLTSHKGINLPSGTIRAASVTSKDRQALLFGLEHNVDFVAVSFVKSAADIKAAKEIIAQKGFMTPVIAKIERHEALGNIESIMAVADGVMVARGDLGIEIPLEEVPLIQKQIIRLANKCGKPVITATQMLRSMVNTPRPTRAEVTDVVNAVLDGTDAVMLSEETATGDYPVAAVKYMDRLTVTAETKFPYNKYLQFVPDKNVSESVAHASCVLADHLGASAIVAYTQSGLTAGHISRFRPRQPIIALSPNKETVRKLGLVWGCLPHLIQNIRDTDDVFEKATQSALETGEVKKGQTIVITSGHPIGVMGKTNMLRVKIV
ncbi:MAG: pyruvate kinase [Deltaproteobacteria bacterium]|nr:pyruvate kinase [Deltaproteobacteria bacterium]